MTELIRDVKYGVGAIAKQTLQTKSLRYEKRYE